MHHIKTTFDLALSDQDYKQIEEHGISLENIKNQLLRYRAGVECTVILEPAQVGKGIIRYEHTDLIQKASFFDQKKANLKIVKFVPASGAASRMFKFLAEFLRDFDIEKETIKAHINRTKASELSIFIVGMNKFAFYDQVVEKLKLDYPNFIGLDADHQNYYFIKTMLSEKHFDFSNLPKAVLPFHKYKNHVATPIEEHLLECQNFSNSNGLVKLHFTISEKDQAAFDAVLTSVKNKVETETNSTIDVSFSYQNKKTDIIAVDMQNKPFREDSGKLLFRPGGHGALIENIYNLDGDIIFIKNIDNVIQTHREVSVAYKKALGGILLELQASIFAYLSSIESNEPVAIDELIDFVQNTLFIKIKPDFHQYSDKDKLEYIRKILDRPIRVCGMVKNEGDTGGGPFWVLDPTGKVSLQIVETAQIDLNDPEQLKIFRSSTHFNPVDLACGIKNFKGQKFDLNQYVDHNSGFIVEKSQNGVPLKSYELPGLWNGAMANWITIFVEVPLITFNPVKTVNDLLKQPHQQL